MRHFIVLAVLVAVAQARPQDFYPTSTTQSPEASFLGLPASADEALERTIDVKFSCANRRLGYYADMSNDCKVFHICNPMELPDGQKAVMQYSFFCPVNTTFDQQSLTCAPYSPVPCGLAEKYYHVNDLIGVSSELPDIRREPETGATVGVTAHAAPHIDARVAAPIAARVAAPVGTIQTFHAINLQPQLVQNRFQTRPQQVTTFHQTPVTNQYPARVIHTVPAAGQITVVPPSPNVVRLG